MKIHKTKTARPYNAKGKTNFPLRRTPGVYIIQKYGKVIYVGYGKDVYKAMYRHFEKWNEGQQYRVKFESTDPSLSARVIYTPSAAKAKQIETALILKYRPTKNENIYIDFEPEESERIISKFVIDAEDKPIIQYKGEIDF